MKEEDIKKLNLFQKISKITENIEYLQKDDKVITNAGTGAGYKAISEEKVTDTVKKGLVKYGVVIIPISQVHKRDDEVLKDKYGNDKVNRLTTVDVTYRIQNIDDKEDFINAVSSGTGVDTQDKGIGKAMTYAYKYLLLRTFAIPTGEDTDKISSEVYSEQFLTRNRIEEFRTKVKSFGQDAVTLLKEKGYKFTTMKEEHYVEVIKELENKKEEKK